MSCQHGNWPPCEYCDEIETNVAHATAARDAEIEALRAEVAKERDYAAQAANRVLKAELAQRKAEARAERLAEALRLISKQGTYYGPDGTRESWQHWAEIARAALEQEEGRG